ncbi:MAG: insulinase family protein [Elusimicrobia bacterium]|nr:insulinase family protein [Candidatus Obscuribacterium magneticum]
MNSVIPAKAGIQALNMFLRKWFKTWIPAFAGMTICVLVAGGLHAAPPKVPPFPPLVYSPPKPERLTLKNGIVVYLLEDHELPLFQMSLSMKVTPMDEPKDRPGSMRFMGGQWRAGGTLSRPPEALNEELEQMSASVETSAGEEAATISMSCLTKDRDKTMELFSDVLFHPAFRGRQLELAKSRALEDVKAKNDTLYSISRRAVRDVVYGPSYIYAFEQTPKTIGQISRRDLMDIYRRVVAPEEAILTVSGDFKKEELLMRLESLSMDWKPRGRRVVPYDYSDVTTREGRIFVVHKDFNQSRLVMARLGISRHHSDHFAVDLANMILGEGGSSRLYGQIRSRLGLAYMVGSFSIEPKGPGMLGVLCQTKAESTVQALSALQKELEAFSRAEPKDEEMILAKDMIINSFIFRFGSPSQIVSEQSGLEFYGYPKDYLDTYVDKIRALSKKDVWQAARTWFSNEAMKVVIVGDKTKFMEDLKKLGPVTEILLDQLN